MGKQKSDALLLKIDGELKDLDSEYSEESSVEELNSQSEEAADVYKHSCAHLLAHAVIELYPDVQYGIGPAIETGFYYDFLTPRPFTPEDLEEISKKMKHLAKQNLKIQRLVWDRQQAIDYFLSKGQHLKVELINEKVEENKVTVYKQGDFVDLCRGPHLPRVSYLKHFKLLSVAAAYWKGDETSHSLQRIYGVVFPSAQELQNHLNFLKEAQNRDHRKLGKDLGLFTITDEIGAGLVLWHPKGGIIRHEIEKFWYEEHLKNGYQLVNSPHIARIDLWNTSGHNDFYKENMFTPISFDNTDYQLKPMNCPFHMVIYKSRNRSYKEMPFRWAELGTVYRYERSGVLHGLMRVRGFTQDDAHIFCTPSQMEEEVDNLLDFSLRMLKTFGFSEMDIYLSTRPEKYVGEIEDWEMATTALKNSLEKTRVNYKIDPGEGVFYGPKIDIKVKDVLKRSWQCTTIQVDFNLPKRFNLKYSDDQGKIRQPIIIHRAVLGSLERFFGVLIEHYGGFFPVWLAPVQVMVIPITERNMDYARNVYEILKINSLRAELDERSEGVGRKIRDAELQKIPYIIILGDEEQKDKNISLRIHKKGDQGKRSLEEFIEKIKPIIFHKEFNYEI
ncbi:MAG: threonine--tRNA ligase [Candidatus Aminicenantes bacterium]|nr:MAG: threonine--tRNA ligase [Candidatus Aminicenantes bacterium]